MTSAVAEDHPDQVHAAKWRSTVGSTVVCMAVPEPPSHLSAEAREFLLNLPAPAPPLDLTDFEAVAQVRQAAHAMQLTRNSRLTGRWASRSETIAGVTVVRFASDERHFDREPVIVHLHGGAFVLGSPMASATLIVPLVQSTNLPVVSVDYRLAPEHRCPAGLDDIVSVCERLARSQPLAAIYGESAGAGLTVAAAVILRDTGAALPGRLGLLSPWVDLTCSGDSYRTLAHADPILGSLDPTAYAAAYAGPDVADLRASPLRADLAGLPPTLIQAGTREILLSDSCRLDAALRQAGVTTRLELGDGLWHGWQLQHHIPEALQALDRLAGFFSGA